MLEIQSEKVHDEIHCTSTAMLCAGVPELRAGAKQFDVLARDIGVPPRGALVSARLEAAILLGVIRQRLQANRRIHRTPANQNRVIHRFHPPPDPLLLLVSKRQEGGYSHPNGWQAPEDVFIALGSTIKVAGSQAAFRAVDFTAVVALARAGKAAGATKLGVVSAMGANADSSVFYNRVKGEMEQALAQLGYRALVIARPSMLAGDRDALDQAPRPAERLGLLAMALLKPLLPANYRTIAATRVAQALLRAVHSTEQGTRVLPSGEMQLVC